LARRLRRGQAARQPRAWKQKQPFGKLREEWKSHEARQMAACNEGAGGVAG